jgi:hypothetical protein
MLVVALDKVYAASSPLTLVQGHRYACRGYIRQPGRPLVFTIKQDRQEPSDHTGPPCRWHLRYFRGYSSHRGIVDLIRRTYRQYTVQEGLVLGHLRKTLDQGLWSSVYNYGGCPDTSVCIWPSGHRQTLQPPDSLLPESQMHLATPVQTLLRTQEIVVL